MQILNFQGVGFGYPGQTLILSGVNFSLTQGERAIILGANGSGKSTLALLTARLLEPQTGTIAYRTPDGNSLRTGIVFQNSRSQMIGATVEEDLAFGLTLLNESGARIRRKVSEFLQLFQLTEKRRFSCEQLSGGELRRLALAAALITGPEILILDEPLAMLDSYNQAVFLYCLQNCTPRRTAVLWLDHDLRSIRHCRTYYHLSAGRIQQLTPGDLNDRSFLDRAALDPAPLQFLEWRFPNLVSQAIFGPEQVEFHDDHH
jgi:energy-coupling factor transporter ATP-binding protein EcfA2